MTDARWYRWRDGDTGLYWAGSGGYKASGATPKEAVANLLITLLSIGVDAKPPAPDTKPPSPAGTPRD